MSHSSTPPMIVITGPTATGKTALAARLASHLDGEVISADSRQVYRDMNLGTGKDLDDFVVDGKNIPYHLIDIADPGYEYNVYEFQQDFLKSRDDILSRKKQVILCGGTGLYIEAAISGYTLIKVPQNQALRKRLEALPMETLTEMLGRMKPLHNITDTTDRARLTRAIEIATHEKSKDLNKEKYPPLDARIFAIWFERSVLRKRITERLKDRLARGMVNEVEGLLKGGITPGQLMFYGLEYRYLTQYVTGEISHEEMFQKLNTAIHQFAKRQMTWFRRMEKKGFHIHWLDGTLSAGEKLYTVIRSL